MILAITILILTLIWAWFSLSNKSSTNDSHLNLEAKFFLLVIGLYTLPLPTAVLLGMEGGNLSIYIDNFSPWLPSALYFTSAFILSFVVFYKWVLLSGQKNNTYCLSKLTNRTRFKLIWWSIFGICILLLHLLARDVGGVLSLVFSGYRVTELFVGQGHFAVSFEWLVSLAVILMSYGIVLKRSFAIRWAWILGVLLFFTLVIMGRRGLLAVMILAYVYLAIQAGWIKRLHRFFVPGLFLFIVMNWLGLVRGESYTDIIDLVTILFTKTLELGDGDGLLIMLFYTLIYGNFVVPFETLPQIMGSLSQSWDYWFGWTIPRSFATLIPNFLMPDRPLPMSNWYMETYYGGGLMLNEGRQFFFLSEAFLNFGWFGLIIWGLVIAAVFKFFFDSQTSEVTYWKLALRALFFGSLLNFVASDTTGFFVAYLKGWALIPLVFALLDKKNAKN